MKLFLALPVYGGYNPHFINCLLELVTHRPCSMMVRACIGDSLVARARNRLCAEFLQSGATHLLFLDTDLMFSVDHIARLISHDVAIVAGLYPKKQKELGWVCNLLDSNEQPGADGLQRVKYAGTGCLLIARRVFERMIEVHPEIEYDPDDGDTPGLKWDFFATGVRSFNRNADNATAASQPVRRRYLSEDWLFCQRALDLGFDIFMDTQVVLKHVGEIIYPLQDIREFADPIPETETETETGNQTQPATP